MSKQPWMKFYPSDWRSDPALRICSVAARGLWMEMLCIAHESEPRGSLAVNGNPVSAKALSALAGVPEKELSQLLAELENAGVFSRDDDGVIFSRRIRRDEERSRRDKANGKKGGNPTLKEGVNPHDNPPNNRRVNGVDKAQKPEARSQKPDASHNGLQGMASLRVVGGTYAGDDAFGEAGE